jgi:hypothetical protein
MVQRTDVLALYAFRVEERAAGSVSHSSRGIASGGELWVQVRAERLVRVSFWFSTPNTRHRTIVSSMSYLGRFVRRSILGFALFVICTTSMTNVSLAAGRLTIHPTGTVHIGQTVTVTGVGFTPGDTVYITECFRSECDVTTATPRTITSTGVLSPTRFRLVGYLPSPEECGSKYARTCYLAVGNVEGSDRATVTIKFRKLL